MTAALTGSVAGLTCHRCRARIERVNGRDLERETRRIIPLGVADGRPAVCAVGSSVAVFVHGVADGVSLKGYLVRDSICPELPRTAVRVWHDTVCRGER